HAANVDEAENHSQTEDDRQHDQAGVLGHHELDAEEKLRGMQANRQGAESPLECSGGSATAQEQTHDAEGYPPAAVKWTKKQTPSAVPGGGERFNRRKCARFRSAGGDVTGVMRDSSGSVQSFISPAKSNPGSNGASQLFRWARAQTSPAAGTTFCSREATDCFPSTPLCCLDLFLVDLPPFLALGDNVLFCFLERFINPLALEQIAGLAGSHQVFHAPL